MHHLVAKTFDEFQIGSAVVAGGKAEELRLALRRRFNRGVRADDLIAHLGERQALHVVGMIERVVLDLDEIEPRQLPHVLGVRLYEASGDEHRKWNALVEQVIEHGSIERYGLALFAGIERQRDDLLVRRQPRDDIGARDRRRENRGRDCSDEPNPPHAQWMTPGSR